jgi:hypothetical protein
VSISSSLGLSAYAQLDSVFSVRECWAPARFPARLSASAQIFLRAYQLRAQERTDPNYLSDLLCVFCSSVCSVVFPPQFRRRTSALGLAAPFLGLVRQFYFPIACESLQVEVSRVLRYWIKLEVSWSLLLSNGYFLNTSVSCLVK